MTDNTEPTIDTLKANILTEFKQVLKLAPADYTENCTNVVMSLVDEYVADQVAKARIEELNTYCKFLNDKPADSIVLATELMDRYLYRIATLNGVKK